MSELDRYHRQMLLPGIGEAGQRKLREAHALVVGCGALGTIIVDALARAGIGMLTIVDRDLVEITNLQRQVLFDERDVEQGMPKAEAARLKVHRINRQVEVRAHVDDFNHRNAERYARDADLLLDGVDNFETRFLLNDVAVRHGVPYLYGGAVGTTGMTMPVLPHPERRATGLDRTVRWSADQSTPCLRCVFPEAPPPGASATCDTAGVLGSIVAVIAAHQVTQSIKLLTGHLDRLDRSLVSIDNWHNEWRRLDISNARESGSCPCCVEGRFEYLDGRTGSATTSLCGRNAVQITPAEGDPEFGMELRRLAERLAPHGEFQHNQFLLRGVLSTERGDEGEPIELTVFPNGRAIVKGVTEPQVARSIYAKYIGA